MFRICPRSFWQAAPLDVVPSTKPTRFGCLFEPGVPHVIGGADREVQGAHGAGVEGRMVPGHDHDDMSASCRG